MDPELTLPERYQRDGYLVLERLLAPSDIERMSERITAIAAGQVAGFPAANVEYEPGYGDPEPATQPVGPPSQATLVSPGGPAVRKINQCAERDEVFMQVAQDPRIVDVVAMLLGPDIKLYGSQCFMKPAGGIEKPYHQDSAYFTIEPLALVTCWIALDDVTLDNGCLWVIPGSHLGELHEHSEPWQVGDRVDMQVPEARIDRLRETPITMPAGSCSFHHSKLLHRSGPNRSLRPRRGLAIHYMSARSRWTHPSHPQPSYPQIRGQQFEGCV
ncbi:MAG: phytanoyl-CoA dioxygenase family protein [Planctomycetales bacterium]|nr:phytanoyl-CoA dioxygenase family protein [Planctomycetales bacterium]